MAPPENAPAIPLAYALSFGVISPTSHACRTAFLDASFDVELVRNLLAKDKEEPTPKSTS
jgi:hypothetical protein